MDNDILFFRRAIRLEICQNMFWMKLHPPSVQVTETASGCDINTDGYSIANYNVENIKYITNHSVKRKVKIDIANSGVTIIKERHRKYTLSRTTKLNTVFTRISAAALI